MKLTVNGVQIEVDDTPDRPAIDIQLLVDRQGEWLNGGVVVRIIDGPLTIDPRGCSSAAVSVMSDRPIICLGEFTVMATAPNSDDETCTMSYPAIKRTPRGFTLVELLVVILVIGCLAGIIRIAQTLFSGG